MDVWAGKVKGMVANTEYDIKTLRGYLGMMEKSLNKQNDFIADILDYSRNARLEVSRDEINFETLVADIFEQYQFFDENNSIKKELVVEQEEVFITDRQRISIILNNLISNALKYCTVGNTDPLVRVVAKIKDGT